MVGIKMVRVLVILALLTKVYCLNPDVINMSVDYFMHNELRHICYLSCDKQSNNLVLTQQFSRNNIRVSVKNIDIESDVDLMTFLHAWNIPTGVVLDGSCANSDQVLWKASKLRLFGMLHFWLVWAPQDENCSSAAYIMDTFENLNLSVNAEIKVVSKEGDLYNITDVFNFGKIQGNGLELTSFGSWQRKTGLSVELRGYKYYNRWDFHNLSFRTISVVCMNMFITIQILEKPETFHPEMLTENKYTKGVPAMTKVPSQLLQVLKEQHNFRFNYTIVDVWIGSVDKHANLSVTKALYWEQQDLASTSIRLFAHWQNWCHVVYPPVTVLHTKFYYIIPERGVGSYENRFLTPMSPAVWYCALATALVCAVVLGAAAALETRPRPGLYAVFSVVAAMCQQAYEDGFQILEEAFSSQGRKVTMLVIGLTSMLLYNYYTSSVVSWLLNAAAPSIGSLDQLIDSDLEVVFEDMGYARGWFTNAGIFYFSGFKNPKEDTLREKKVLKAKRTTPVLQPAESGIELIRTGKYAFHTEPYVASQVIAKRFGDEELCNLGGLTMMYPAPVYMLLQRWSPYKEFFVWSLMRLLERGQVKASRARFAGTMPECSGQRPRALALGQAAPAFLLLFLLTLLALTILCVEILWHRIQTNKAKSKNKARSKCVFVKKLAIGRRHC